MGAHNTKVVRTTPWILNTLCSLTHLILTTAPWLKYELLASPFYRWRKQGTEMLRPVPNRASDQSLNLAGRHQSPHTFFQVPQGTSAYPSLSSPCPAQHLAQSRYLANIICNGCNAHTPQASNTCLLHCAGSPCSVRPRDWLRGVPENAAKQFHWPVDPHCPQALECQTRAGVGGAAAFWPAA